MTRERLEEYKSKKDEIKELEHKLMHLGDGDSMIGNDVIFDYQTGFPRPQTVVGYDYDRYKRLSNIYQKRLEKLRKECAEIELWIEEIQDSMTRRIFRMYFVDKMTQRQVGKIMHMDKSTVGRKIDEFLKVAPNTPNAPL